MARKNIDYDECQTIGCDGLATSLQHSVCQKCYGVISRMQKKDKKTLSKRAQQLRRSSGCLNYFSATYNKLSAKQSLPVFPGQVRLKNPRHRSRY